MISGVLPAREVGVPGERQRPRAEERNEAFRRREASPMEGEARGRMSPLRGVWGKAPAARRAERRSRLLIASEAVRSASAKAGRCGSSVAERRRPWRGQTGQVGREQRGRRRGRSEGRAQPVPRGAPRRRGPGDEQETAGA